ncbi:hypothetical protein L195_g049511, partial [Trifolium pratense]
MISFNPSFFVVTNIRKRDIYIITLRRISPEAPIFTPGANFSPEAPIFTPGAQKQKPAPFPAAQFRPGHQNFARTIHKLHRIPFKPRIVAFRTLEDMLASNQPWNFRWFHKLQPQTLLVSNYLQQSNKLPSLITVASTQGLHSDTTLVYLHLKLTFLHQSLKV